MIENDFSFSHYNFRQAKGASEPCKAAFNCQRSPCQHRNYQILTTSAGVAKMKSFGKKNPLALKSSDRLKLCQANVSSEISERHDERTDG